MLWHWKVRWRKPAGLYFVTANFDRHTNRFAEYSDSCSPFFSALLSEPRDSSVSHAARHHLFPQQARNGNSRTLPSWHFTPRTIVVIVRRHLARDRERHPRVSSSHEYKPKHKFRRQQTKRMPASCSHCNVYSISSPHLSVEQRRPVMGANEPIRLQNQRKPSPNAVETPSAFALYLALSSLSANTT